ncbi:hypothetical protein NDU88_000090 [Pleurodeles waltl]|uniref:Uncharacterized protein n=1 Tax=Pleurodeles waltl TaxID=8319 RepID=A0AAV7V460_PLEWA|nr:hypothetical protein NDU88_000090 [Pleurodeles waltl]
MADEGNKVALIRPGVVLLADAAADSNTVSRLQPEDPLQAGVEEANESETSALMSAKYPEAVCAKTGAVLVGVVGVSRSGTE